MVKNDIALGYKSVYEYFSRDTGAIRTQQVTRWETLISLPSSHHNFTL